MLESRPDPLKLAVVGKGGAGKTVLASLLARALSERGLMVLAVDLDANPGLALSLGLPAHDIPLPAEAVEQQAGAAYGWALASHLSPAETVRRYGVPAGDRIVFLGFGNNAALGTPITHYVTAVRQVAQEFDEPGWVVVGDLAAGPTNTFEGYAKFASLALVAVEPTATAVVTAQGLLEILGHDAVPAEVVVTKARSEADVDLVARTLSPLCALPYDVDVRRFERSGSLTGLPDDSPALEAVRGLVTRLGL